MKAKTVSDIRMTNDAGAVEFNAFRRTMFYTCPCGCGLVGYIELMKCNAQRNPPEIRYLEVGLDGKLCPGELMPIGIICEDGAPHWTGTLAKGEWHETCREGLDGDRSDDGKIDGGSTRIFLQDREEAEKNPVLSSGKNTPNGN